MSEPRYSVGIDLGTTNSVVSFVDLEEADGDQAPRHIRIAARRKRNDEPDRLHWIVLRMDAPTHEGKNRRQADRAAPFVCNHI